jgi:phospholipid/cholesterol/gamma-HCH transport system ATP-binding protein
MTGEDQIEDMPMIEFKNVTISFSDEVVLKDVNFRIDPGETKIILGESGSGKSTILKLILGLIKPDSGEIIIEGQNIVTLTEQELVSIRQNIGMVFQEGALFDSLDVRENVGYRLFEEGALDEDEIEIAVLEQLGFVGLKDSIDKMPAELSGGMKRRVGIARALVGTPKIVLYDEPTAGLDPITKRTIVELIIKLRDMEKVTSVFVTHDLHAASVIAREHAFLDKNGSIDFHLKKSAEPQLSNINLIMLLDGAICFEGSYQDFMNSSISYIKTFAS